MQVSAASDAGAALERPRQHRRCFGHRAFALFWVSRIVSILSFQMLMVAIGWQLYELTGSAFDLGLSASRSSSRCCC